MITAMIHGNTCLKKCAQLLGITGLEFRKLLFTNKLNLESSHLLFDQISWIKSIAIPAIMEVDKIKNEVFTKYGYLVNKIAKKYHWKHSEIPLDDYEQEGRLCLLDCIFGYTDDTKEFAAYVQRALKNKLFKFINNNNLMHPFTNEVLSLLQNCSEMKRKLPEANNEEIMNAMGISEEKKQKLVAAWNAKSINLSEKHPHKEKCEDYTGLRKGITHEDDTVKCYYELYESIKSADLTSIELQALIRFAESNGNWKAQLSREFINKNTGKCYSRYAIDFILERAIAKVRQVYFVENTAEGE